MADKEVEFCGDALKRIRSFSDAARQDTGYQIHRLQRGLEPDDWKLIATVGPGVREIRVSDIGNIFRTFYLTNIGDKIYILHAFQKKTEQTSQKDVDIGKKRLSDLKRRLAIEEKQKCLAKVTKMSGTRSKTPQRNRKK